VTSNPSHCFDTEEMITFVENHVTDPIFQRKFRLLAREASISKKYSAVPDFCKRQNVENELFYGLDPNPTTEQRMNVYEKMAVELGLKNVLQTLEKSNTKASDLTHIISVSCTGMMAPGLETALVEKLGLSRSTKRYAVNFMGCYASFHALRLADHIATGDENARVLVVSIELCTLHFRVDPSNDNILSTYLFGDGVGSCIVSSQHTHPVSLELLGFESLLISDGKEEMEWHIGNNGFEMVLSSKVSKSIEANIKNAVDILMLKNAISFNDVQQYAIHPGGKNIIKAFETALGLEEKHLKYSYEVLRDYGNMSSATILFVLQKLIDESTIEQKGNLIYSAAFGPGLTVESGLMRLS
jgi:predicted naringenin-chalcone synthase